ncbi:MAG: nucleoside 2-deoxyribosyltransferase, partial [Leptolyngbyaceae bacterium]|nr:nucleoside 2-deoxyribosyltransferase [Leptolyngbyaceae bacterium]
SGRATTGGWPLPNLKSKIQNPKSPMSSPWIYLAGPLFTQAEITFNQLLCDRLRSHGYSIYLPQQECAGITDPATLFQVCMRGLDGADRVLVILDGTDADSGSCFEMGYAFAKGLPIIGLRTDFRGSGEHLGLNLMLTHSCSHLLLTTAATPPPSTEKITYSQVGEDIVPKLLKVLEDLLISTGVE